MLQIIAVIALVLGIGVCNAQGLDTSQIDAAARASKANSVMFNRFAPGSPMQQAYEEEMKRRAYEEEMKRRAEYEEAMRQKAYEEEKRRREEALKPVNLFGNSLKIFAEVNGEIITSLDMQDRVNAFVATTQIPVNEQTKSMVMEKVLQATIDEKIKLQEAQRNAVEISEEELDKGMVNFAEANNITVQQLKQMLKKAQVDEDVLCFVPEILAKKIILTL